MTGLHLFLLATAAIPLSALPISAQEAADAITLDTVTLRSTHDTEGIGSYTTGFISLGGKDTRSFREIPQSTTVVTPERLEDGGYTSLDTALRKTPGVDVLSNDDGRSSLCSRGFGFDSLDLNGLPTPLSGIYGTQPDMAAVDHTEILRGPSGLFGGPGEPAGTINMRPKQPQDVFGTNLSASARTWATPGNTVGGRGWLRRSHDPKALSLDAPPSKPFTRAGHESNLMSRAWTGRAMTPGWTRRGAGSAAPRCSTSTARRAAPASGSVPGSDP